MRRPVLQLPVLSIRAHLAALALVVGLPLVLLELQSARALYRMTVAREALSAQGVAESAASAATQFLSVSEGLLAAAADELGGRLLDPEACPGVARAINGSTPFFINVAVADGDGRVICSAISTGVHADVRGRRWFEEARSTGAFAVGAPVVGSITGAWVIGLGAPILGPDGSVLGVLGASVPLERFQRILAGTRVGDDELVTIADGGLVVIARSSDPGAWVGKRLPSGKSPEEELEGEAATLLRGVDLDEVDRVWAKLSVPSVGWYVYAGIPADRVLGPARRAALQRGLWTGLVVLLAGMVAARLHLLISRSLSRLVDGARAVAEGRSMDIPPGAPAEVVALAEQLQASLDARSRAEVSERLATERYRSIFDNAVFGIYASTPDGRFLEVNPALAAMVGYAPDELKELGPGALYRDLADRARFVELYGDHRVIHGQELEWVRKDGSPITVRITGRLVMRAADEESFEVMAEDITEEKRLQAELRHTQKMDALGRLAGGVAHDFNNLLTVIGGNSHVLLSDLPDDDPRRPEVQEIAEAASRAEALTRQLLAFSRKERPRSRIVDLNDLLVGLERMLGRLMREDIEVLTQFDTRVRPVLADPGQLEQVVLNLAVNARDAMPQGGRLVFGTRWSRTGPWPHRGAAAAEGWSCIRVSDTGVGMSDAVRERIFEPFFTTKGKGAGTGLGLATAYAIVEAAGGQILVDSTPGRGATFEVWLPVADAPEAAPEEGEAEAGQPGGGDGRTVLVVEDEAPVRRIVERVLTSAGFDVLLASDGAEAIRLADDHEGPLALVITDVIMPHVKGEAVADHLARTRPDTPVLFMSGYPDSAAVERRVAADPDGFLPKPFTPGQLRARVQRLVGNGAGAAASCPRPASA